MKTVLVKMKDENINLVSFIIILLFFSSCSWDKCAPLEMELKKQIVEADSIYSIPLNNLTNFEWTDLYVISGPRFPQEVKEITGLEYNKVIQDDRRQLIFILGNSIVKEYSSSCRNFSWGRLTFSKGEVRFLNKDSIYVRRRLVADEWWLFEAVPN